MKIMLVEDNTAQREILSGFLQKQGFQVMEAADGQQGIDIFRQNPVDIVISDYRMPRKNGLELLQEIRDINPLVAVIIITAYSDVNDAVAVIKAGAMDYILKPLNLDELLLKIRQAASHLAVQKESEEVFYKMADLDLSGTLIGNSANMREVLSVARRVSHTPATVLISGESGTGKELLADIIHQLSPRREYNLVKVNCAALPDNLLESELFGHVKGSFTGAIKDRKGRFEEADKGTIFLDEIGEISPVIQVKLLRVLQNMTFEPVGSSRPVQVNVRVIAATNRNLENELASGNFREDLYYRLNVVPIHIPPLRERREDIPLLIEHFLGEMAVQDRIQFSRDALMQMVSYQWEGNIRQLKNIITRLVTLARSDVITSEDLPQEIRRSAATGQADTLTLAAVEKEHIVHVLQFCHGNQQQAAAILGVHRNTLARKIREYGIEVK